MNSFIKDPDAILDYGFDWSNWLASGEEISSSEWEVPSGITKDNDVSSTTATTIWLSGGTVGEEYTITNRIVTTGGRTEDRSLKIVVKDR